MGGKFRDLSMSHENNESWHPTKITRYTVTTCADDDHMSVLVSPLVAIAGFDCLLAVHHVHSREPYYYMRRLTQSESTEILMPV